MKPKYRRLLFTAIGIVLMAAAVALVLSALKENIVFFHSPYDVSAAKATAARTFRLGGLVAEDSVERSAGSTTVAFTITDGAADIRVQFTGILPDLFREGQGVVTEGKLNSDVTFVATEVLAKHDETYMRPEVAAALKESGHWRDEGGQ